MYNSDVELIIKSLLIINKEKIKVSDIAKIIIENFKKDLKKENKNIEIKSVKNRVRRILNKDLSLFDLILVGKESSNGANIYKKKTIKENIDLFDEFDFSDTGHVDNDEVKSNQVVIKKLLNYIVFLKSLENKNIGMACDSAIIFWMFSVLNAYLRENYQDSVINPTMSELSKLISGSLKVPDFVILNDLKLRKVTHSDLFDFSILNDKLKIEEYLLQELNNDK